MPTNAQLLGWLEAIDIAIATGATRVSYNGQTVDYVDPNKLRIARSELRARLGIPTGHVRRTLAGYSGGFGPVEGSNR